MYSTTYFAGIVNILAVVLPLVGVNVGSEALTTTVQTVVLIATAIWVLIRRYSRGDISPIGVRK